MVTLVRVDDRLLHGQIICAWVPFTGADTLIVASDEAAADSFVSDVIASCGHKGLKVYVKNVRDTVDYIGAPATAARENIILIVGDLQDAMRVYEYGMRFGILNIGNVHHEDDGREITPSVILNAEDERILGRFEGLGVKLDIRDVPASPAAAYRPKKDGAC